MVLDRRLQQDDNRGLGQGVTDNKVTASLYDLLLEDRTAEAAVRQLSSEWVLPKNVSAVGVTTEQYLSTIYKPFL